MYIDACLCQRIIHNLTLTTVDASVRCPDPRHPKHGSRHPSPEGDDYPQGAVIRYTCFPQFDIHGPVTRMCLANGQWSEKAPECLSKYTYFK